MIDDTKSYAAMSYGRIDRFEERSPNFWKAKYSKSKGRLASSSKSEDGVRSLPTESRQPDATDYDSLNRLRMSPMACGAFLSNSGRSFRKRCLI
jgi:hypothetical protein